MTLSNSDFTTAFSRVGGGLAQVVAKILRLRTDVFGANGLLLDASSKIRSSYLPASGGSYLGFWNASTNTPTVTAGSGTAGDEYYVSVAGTQSITGSSVDFEVGGRIKYSGTAWEYAEPPAVGSGTVNSVNGKTGPDITLTRGDFGLEKVSNLTPAEMPLSDAAIAALALKLDRSENPFADLSNPKSVALSLGQLRLTPKTYGVPLSGDVTTQMQAFIDLCGASGAYVADLSEEITYRVSQLTFPVGFRSVGTGAIFRSQSTPGGEPEPYCLNFQAGTNVERINLSLPGGNVNYGGLYGAGDNMRFGMIKVTADTIHRNGAIGLTGNNLFVGEVLTDKCDYVIGINGGSGVAKSNVFVGKITATSYVRCLRVALLDNFYFGLIDARVASPYTSFDPGKNVVLMEGMRNGRFESIHAENSGEHSVRMGGSSRMTYGVSIGVLRTIGGQGCPLKLNCGVAGVDDISDVHVGLLDIQDNGTFGNSQGLRMNTCRRIRVDVIKNRAINTAFSLPRLISVNDVEDISIGLVDSQGCRDGLLSINANNDTPSPGTYSRRIRIDRAILKDQAGANLIGVSVNSPHPAGYDISEIEVNNLWASGSYERIFSAAKSTGNVPYNVDDAIPTTGVFRVRGEVAAGCSTVVSGLSATDPNIQFELRQGTTVFYGNPRDRSLTWDYSLGRATMRPGGTGSLAVEYARSAATSLANAFGLEFSAEGTNTTNCFGAGLIFSCNDPDLGSKKRLAGILPKATQTFNGPTNGGTQLAFFATRTGSATAEEIGWLGVQYTGATAELGNAQLELQQFGAKRRVFGSIEADVTFDVGSSGDFPTMQAAFDALGHVPIKNGVTVTLRWKAGTVLSAGVRLLDGDYSAFVISHVTASPGNDANGIPQAQMTLTNSFPSNTPLLYGERAKMPTWNVLVDMNGKGARGIELIDGSEIVVNAGKGILRATGVVGTTSGETAGLYLASGSRARARESVFAYCNRGIWVTRASGVDAEKAICDRNTAIGLYCSRASQAAFADGKARYCTSGVVSNGNSIVRANTDSDRCDASNCGRGFIADEGGKIECNAAWAKNCTTAGVSAEDGGHAVCKGTDTTGSTVGYRVTAAGFIQKSSSTGTNSQTANSMTANGLILGA